MVEEESKPKRKSNVIPFRRIAAVAASLVLVFSLSVTANAFSFRDAWDAVVNWAQETFSFSMGVEVSEPKAEDELEYASFQEFLIQYKFNASIMPSYIPNGFDMVEVLLDETPKQKTYLALYLNGEKSLRISIKSFLNTQPEQMEKSSDLIEKYHCNGIDYYIFQNNDSLQAAWLIDTYECCIAGNITINDLKLMIDSIEKG